MSVSGILIGSALANSQGTQNTTLLVLALLTAMGFQITSNFANDYGDGVKGTDNAERIGPKRVLQSGLLTRKTLKRGIVISVIVNILLVIAVVYLAFGLQNITYALLFVALGVISIWAAIRYTVGDTAYGYRGMGDVFVFLFFGLLAVLGTQFLFTKNFWAMAILPAISIGALSTAVLNLNNLRDYKSDKNAGKNTLVVKMGYTNGIKYHIALLTLGFIGIGSFLMLTYSSWTLYIPLLAFLPILGHGFRVVRAKDPSLLDPELKKLALSIFVLALLFYISNNIFL